MSEAEELVDGVRILKGPPVPAVMPAKGICVLISGGKLEFHTLSRMGTSDMSVHTPVTFKNALKFMWNLWKERNADPDKSKSA